MNVESYPHSIRAINGPAAARRLVVTFSLFLFFFFLSQIQSILLSCQKSPLFGCGYAALGSSVFVRVIHSREFPCMRTTVLLTALLALALQAPALQWPNCEVRSGTAGGPAIHIDGQPKAPLFFCGNNQFGRDDVLIEELSMAAGAGIPFFSFQVPLPWRDPNNDAEPIINRFCAAHPKGYFFLRIWVGPSREWLKEHPEERITKHNGECLNMASLASTSWREEAAEQLRARIRQVATGPHGDRFIGAAVHYLQTAEWFYPDTNDFMDYAEVNLEAFRKWLRREYVRLGALRKAWGQKDLSFKTAVFPTPEERDATAWGPFRDPTTHRPAIDMQRFQSDQVVETIAHFARVIKEATRERSLAGTFYGYTFELNNNGPRALAHSGHLSFGKLLENEDIDLVLAPYSYLERRLGGPGHFHLPVDSIALHGKLLICEEDSFTHLAEKPPPGLAAPGWEQRTQSLEETLALTRRNYGNFLGHRCGLWFFDLLSDGRWKSKDFWKSTTLLRRIAAELRSQPPFQPQVAFVADEASVHFLRATTHPELLHSLSLWRAELDRTGAPVGYYLQSDLPRLPDSVRVLILANAYDTSPADRKVVEAILERGGTVIWTYAPDIMTPDGPRPSRIAKLTGFDVYARSDDTPMRIIAEASGATATLGKEPWPLRFIIEPGDHEVLARYEATQEICAAQRTQGNGHVIYTALPRLPVPLLRQLWTQAGVHLYRDTPGMTAIAGNYLILHTGHQTSEHRLTWPKPSAAVTRIVPAGTSHPFPENAPHTFTDKLPPQTTAIYYFGD